jgi:isoquinoline 1-oxidoreductase subunit beta
MRPEAGTGVSRRTFLRTGAAGGAALLIGFRLPAESLAQEGAEKKTAPNPFNAWVRIDSDGTVTLRVAKSEMGQGVLTSLPMILADELGVEWSRVRVEQAPTDPAVYDLGTGGSASIRTSWLPLRRAGAAAREMLVEAAAAGWGVEARTLKAEGGFVVHPAKGRRSYAELVEAASKLPVPDFESVPLKKPEDLRIVGTSVPRTDVPAKVDGSARYGIDVRVPGMLYAVVARCPTFGGRARKFDGTGAKAVPGVRHVVEIEADPGAHSAGGIAVVADSTWAAIRGREALAVEWDRGPHAAETSATLRARFEALAAEPGKVVRSEGDAPGVLASKARRIEAVYQLPFQAHATMEPMNCTVDVRADRAEAWVPSQGPQWAQQVIAQVAKLPPEKVTVHTTLMGGGFGRRYQADFAVEAAHVSKAVGAPVKLLWTREDDTRHCFYRPAAYHRLSAAVGESGTISAWQHRLVSTSIDAFWAAPGKARPESSEIGGAVNLPYAVPNLRVEYAPAPTGVPVAWWRSVEHSINGFVVESFLDEVAAAAGVDPLQLRLRLLAEPRMIREPPDSESTLDTRRLKGVLELAARQAGWGSPLPAGHGRGIAGHFSFDSYVAEVAEVSVAAGRLRVHRVVCAVDCGRAVHPDGVRAQMEGGIVYGLTAALKGAITIDGGAVQQGNFDEYEMLRIDEMPEVEVHIVPSTEAPTGTGEPGLPPLAAAVGNAIFAATGKRVRRLPIRPEDLA